MKNRKPVYRGCPNEQETHYHCIARDNGRVCGDPAITYDPQRAGFVCERHTQQLVFNLTVECLGGQAA